MPAFCLRCPICENPLASDPKEASAKFRPFCSSRCQAIDLGNWLGERYTVPGESVGPPQDGESRNS
ncbi:MAG TPA: DNA gyrase inhibitor YacG [Pseudomonadota bacterium]|nr:DNA gyrase inhibitor YacG [Pseudomonadota bacterium]